MDGGSHREVKSQQVWVVDEHEKEQARQETEGYKYFSEIGNKTKERRGAESREKK